MARTIAQSRSMRSAAINPTPNRPAIAASDNPSSTSSRRNVSTSGLTLDPGTTSHSATQTTARSPGSRRQGHGHRRGLEMGDALRVGTVSFPV
jgi:hypothetical protein